MLPQASTGKRATSPILVPSSHDTSLLLHILLSEPPSHRHPLEMEGASRQTSRMIRSRGTKLLSQKGYLPRPVTRTSLTATQSRALSNSNRNLAPESLFSQFGGTSAASQNQSSGGPTTYFTTRPTLPANTVVRFVPQQTAWIVERMGKFHRILEPGLAILVPFLDRIAYVKSLKESALEIPSQNAITADNVTLELDGVLYTRVFDAYKARYAAVCSD